MSYPSNDTNEINRNILNNIVKQLNKPKHKNYKDHVSTYAAVEVETDKLVTRERTKFMINSVVTLGLIITVFRIIS